MKQETIEKTYELVDEIKSTKEYQRLVELKGIVDADANIQELIHTFQKQNQKYEEVLKYGKYHPDLKQVQISFSKAKEDLYTNEIVKEYKELENKLQTQLDLISKEIANAVSSKIKHPNEFGLINKK